MNVGSSVCAYCRKPDRLTREHLYPKFLYDELGQACLGYNEAADKVTSGERVIRDVCARCNNGILGKLDAYGQQYFRLNRLDRTFRDDALVVVRYEYDLLLRWVLKISYNSYRTVAIEDDPFVSLVPYILTGKPRPKTRFVRLGLELIRDHKLTDAERPCVAEEFQRTGYVPCQILASGRVANRVCEVDCHCRHFQVSAHRFTLFIFSYRTKPRDADFYMRLFRKQFPFTEDVKPESDNISLRVSARDVLEIHAGIHVHPRERMLEALYRRQNHQSRSG